VKIVANRERCIGAGNCVFSAPAVFDQDDDTGTVVVIAERVSEADAAAVRDAVDGCPSQAITLKA
jgi:ferredoxin